MMREREKKETTRQKQNTTHTKSRQKKCKYETGFTKMITNIINGNEKQTNKQKRKNKTKQKTTFP